MGFQIAGGPPGGAAQVALLAAAAAAMGSQSAVVLALGIPGISSTYDRDADRHTRRPGRARPAFTSRLRLLATLIAGAIASGITYAQAPRLAPLIPVALLACVIGLATSIRASRPAA